MHSSTAMIFLHNLSKKVIAVLKFTTTQLLEFTLNEHYNSPKLIFFWGKNYVKSGNRSSFSVHCLIIMHSMELIRFVITLLAV